MAPVISAGVMTREHHLVGDEGERRDDEREVVDVPGQYDVAGRAGP